MATSQPSAWAAKREGTLNKFYTRREVGELLIRELEGTDPKLAIDLGAGEGSLAASVARRWPHCHLTTVDIDPSCAAGLHQSLVEAGARDHEHQLCDALDPALPYILGSRKFDLAVCNPPFFRPEWKRSFADILREADFADSCPTLADVTAEILFLSQNFRLLRSGGLVALIVPDGLATGWRQINFRRALLRQHSLRTAIQLPPHSFVDTEAYCFILIIEKGGVNKETKLLRLNEDGTCADPIYVDAVAAEARLDYAYHSLSTNDGTRTTTLRQLGAEIRRGSLSTIERKALQHFVFHTGDFPSPGEAVILGSTLPDHKKNLVVAQAGDILMARVDRELHDKITIVSDGMAAITDCVYRIRLPLEHQRRAFMALVSDEGRARIRSATKGVGARLLGKGDLLDLPLSK